AAFPDWANWRNEAFGLTVEPSVIIYNKDYFENLPLPLNRSDLTTFLMQEGPNLKKQIGTYDIEKSGLGFLFFARDIQQYSSMWELVHAFAQADVQLYGSSSDMIDRVATGELKLAYNVLGSYAVSRLNKESSVGLLLPDDYMVVFSRVAIVPKKAANAEYGQLFLEYLLSRRGQNMMVKTANFSSLHPAVKGPFSNQGLYDTGGKNLRPIKVTPSLLIYLDQIKREKIIRRWRRVLGLKSSIQN
ncbi:MAG: ABC transporter substrate-binding protein, partial [Alphaproteobacteria bacterium]|nr:ABC transporter substrate-binding protein [Alphaproteobacteria bacterium]